MFETQHSKTLWKRWNINSGNSGVECMAKVDSNMIIAGTGAWLYYTTDNGLH